MTINVEVRNYFIKLLKCILLQLPLPQKPDNINWYQLYALSKEHNVLAMTFSALEKQSVRPPEELWNQWKSAYENSIALDTVQLFELDWLLEECKSQEIRIMPLKGCILKSLYPETYFRSMGDLDFLVDPENTEKLNTILCSRGYDCVQYDQYHHDKYEMPPALVMEPHRELVSMENKKFYQYFHKGFSLGVTSEDNPFHYEMNRKDFFLFYLAHFYKHYNGKGAGIRFVMDFYVLTHVWSEELRIDRIKNDLKSLGLWEFFQEIDKVSKAWFTGSDSTEDVPDEIVEYILGQGIFGSEEQRFANAVKVHGKGKLFLKRLFPRLYYMRWQYPVLRKLPILLPICWGWRIITYPFVKRNMFKLRMKQFFFQLNKVIL